MRIHPKWDIVKYFNLSATTLKILRHRNKKRQRIQYMLDRHGGSAKIYASCHNKERLTRDDALAKQKRTPTMKGYKCQFCEHWHVGHRPK